MYNYVVWQSFRMYVVVNLSVCMCTSLVYPHIFDAGRCHAAECPGRCCNAGAYGRFWSSALSLCGVHFNMCVWNHFYIHTISWGCPFIYLHPFLFSLLLCIEKCTRTLSGLFLSFFTNVRLHPLQSGRRSRSPCRALGFLQWIKASTCQYTQTSSDRLLSSYISLFIYKYILMRIHIFHVILHVQYNCSWI